MNMNRQSIFVIAIFFSLLLVTSSTYVEVKQMIPTTFTVKKVSSSKIIVGVSWDGINEAEDEYVLTKLKCFSDAVTVLNSPQDHVFGDRNTTYELAVHKNDALVRCRTGTIDIVNWKTIFYFRT
uniref:Coproporphyrinogen-III oxidase, aerobic n=1 Tax=Anthurium amnicola TaxID=1678845 RepID=A0A1D1YST8_9ARAE